MSMAAVVIRRSRAKPNMYNMWEIVVDLALLFITETVAFQRDLIPYVRTILSEILTKIFDSLLYTITRIAVVSYIY